MTSILTVSDLPERDRRVARRGDRISEAIVTEPTEEPVEVGALKSHLRIETGDDDLLLSDYIKAARVHMEDMLSRALVTQTWDFWLDAFPDGDEPIYLRHSPLTSVTSVIYTDTNGASQTLAAGKYIVETQATPGRIHVAYNESWPDTRDIPLAVKVRAVMGYGAASAVPEPIRLALKLLAGHFYERREATEAIIGGKVFEIPIGIGVLVARYRVIGVG